MDWWTWTSLCEGDQVLHAWPLNPWFFPWNISAMLSTHEMCKEKLKHDFDPTQSCHGTPNINVLTMALPWTINMLWNAHANIIPKYKIMQQKIKINVQATTMLKVLMGHHPQWNQMMVSNLAYVRKALPTRHPTSPPSLQLFANSW